MGGVASNCCSLRDTVTFPKPARRGAVGGGHLPTAAAKFKPPSPKTDEERQLIDKALRENENLKVMLAMDDHNISQVIDLMWKEQVEEGTAVIKEDAWDADLLYVVQAGEFKATKAGVGNGEVIDLCNYGPGCAFGELALLYLQKRAATVTAVTDGAVWCLDRPNFKKILMKQSDDKIEQYMRYLQGSAFASVKEADKRTVAEALIEKHFALDDHIMTQGEEGHTCYILISGEVAIIKKEGHPEAEEKEINRQTGTAEKPAFVGERALQKRERRAATVKVVSHDGAKALALDKETHDLLCKRNVVPRRRASQRNMDKFQKAMKELSFQNLEEVALLGCGGFGIVKLYKDKTSGEAYALKSLAKGNIVKTGHQQQILNEKALMLMCESRFIIKLFACFDYVDEAQSPNMHMLGFLMEAARGGELFTLYNRHEIPYGCPRHARFYAAGCVFALAHMHAHHIIFRDMKPENLLLDEKGYLKVADFGLAKWTLTQTYTTCGTPQYFAPEMIESKGHNCAVDWWALGVIIFEWLAGKSPFEAATPMKIYSKVKKGLKKSEIRKFPECAQAEHLIKGLCKTVPSERLPLRVRGIKEIKDDAWYKGFDWDKAEAGAMPAPYAPPIDPSSKTAIGVFDVIPEDLPLMLDYEDEHTDGPSWDADFATTNEHH